MTNAELLAKLVTEGCLVQTEGGLLDVAFAGIRDGECWFVPYFPEDQHHLHSIPFAKVTNFYDRDLAFYDENADMVLYFAPFYEWPELDVGKWQESRGRWNQELKSETRRTALADFVGSVLGVQLEL